jgi:hypothetical protein
MNCEEMKRKNITFAWKLSLQPSKTCSLSTITSNFQKGVSCLLES